MLKVNFVDRESLLVDGQPPDDTLMASFQGKEFKFDKSDETFDLTLKSSPYTKVSLIKRKMYMEVYEQK